MTDLAYKLSHLRECYAFSALPEPGLRALAEKFARREVVRAELIVEQGAQSDGRLYVLAEGEAEVVRGYGAGDPLSVQMLGPGQTIGEMDFFAPAAERGQRTATVRATVDSQLLYIDYDDLDVMMDSAPEVSRGFLTMLTSRLSHTTESYEQNHTRMRSAERSLRDLSQFLDLSDASDVGAGIEGLIERLVHTASNLLDADRASLFLIDPYTGELWSKVAEGTNVKEIRVPAGAGVVGWAATHREIVNIPEAYEDERFNPAVDTATGYRTRTILCAPVWSLDNEVLGVVQVINKRSGHFSQDDEALFRAFAHQAAVAVENFNLYRRMLLSHKKMAVLLDIAGSVSGTLDLGELITGIVAKMAEALQCERSSYFVYDRDENELWSMEAHGSELTEIRLPASGGLAGHSATTGEVVRIEDAYADPRFNSSFDQQSGYRTRSVMCVPVPNREGAVTGVVQVINRAEGSFDDDDEELLKAIAAQIGVAFENARLYADTVQMQKYLVSVQESISNGIFTVDQQWCVITANTAGANTLGISAQALVGRDARELLRSNPTVIAHMQRVFDTNQDVAEYDLPFQGAAGRDGSVNLHVMPLTDADGHSQGLVLVLEDITAEKRVKNTLTRYMAKDIVDRMLQDPEQQSLGGVRSTATVLFSDIRGFTTIAENLTAEGTMDLLNEYFGLMVEEVFRERGVLDKFMGDALMAVYGIPFPQQDDAVRAVRTALSMKRVLIEYNARRIEGGLAPIQIGVGINTDEVLSGNMGSSKRMDYTVIGDGVNVSSRLESLNKQYGTEILISETTRAQLDDSFRLRLIDTVVTKGKSQPVDIYEALGERDYRPSDAQVRYGDALEAYRAGYFSQARELFLLGAALDPPSAAMAARCAGFMQTPPSAPWDGVWRALEK